MVLQSVVIHLLTMVHVLHVWYTYPHHWGTMELMMNGS